MATSSKKTTPSSASPVDKALRETASRGLELGAKRSELFAEVNRVKVEILRTDRSALTRLSGQGVNLERMIANYLAACW